MVCMILYAAPKSSLVSAFIFLEIIFPKVFNCTFVEMCIVYSCLKEPPTYKEKGEQSLTYFSFDSL